MRIWTQILGQSCTLHCALSFDANWNLAFGYVRQSSWPFVHHSLHGWGEAEWKQAFVFLEFGGTIPAYTYIYIYLFNIIFEKSQPPGVPQRGALSIHENYIYIYITQKIYAPNVLFHPGMSSSCQVHSRCLGGRYGRLPREVAMRWNMEHMPDFSKVPVARLPGYNNMGFMHRIWNTCQTLVKSSIWIHGILCCHVVHAYMPLHDP